MNDPMERQALKEELTHLQGLVNGLQRVQARMPARPRPKSTKPISGPTEVNEMFDTFHWEFGQSEPPSLEPVQPSRSPSVTDSPSRTNPPSSPERTPKNTPSETGGFFDAFGWNQEEEATSQAEPDPIQPQPAPESVEDTTPPPTTEELFNDFDWR